MSEERRTPIPAPRNRSAGGRGSQRPVIEGPALGTEPEVSGLRRSARRCSDVSPAPPEPMEKKNSRKAALTSSEAASSGSTGKENVLVVIDDLEDSSDDHKTKILQNQPSIREKAQDLFLISPEEKTSNYQRRLMVDRGQVERKLERIREFIKKRQTGGNDGRMRAADREGAKPGRKQEEKSEGKDHIKAADDQAYSKKVEKSKDRGKSEATDDAKKRKKSNGTENEAADFISSGKTFFKKSFDFVKNVYSNTSMDIGFSVPVPFSKKSIGIFSRCSESEYSWLMDLLNSQDFRDQVQSVRPYYISNRFSALCENVNQCKFGILYHSKNRGRINVTNGTDSLYDEELEHLSCRLGQKNVVVVIDDLDDVSDTMKKRILSAQYSISEQAEELILVKCASPEEKRMAAKDALKNILQPKKMEVFKKP